MLFFLVFRTCDYKKETEMLIDDYKQENNYLKIYSSQRINALCKENKELYDKISKLQNVESSVEIKYVYTVNYDTVYVNPNDSTNFDQYEHIYHFDADDDTISYNLDIQGDNVKWFKLDFKINDNLTLINQNDNGINKLTISPGSSHMDITDADAWHREDKSNKWYKRFTVGPQLGFGYGIVNNKPDIFLGVSVGYDILKR